MEQRDRPYIFEHTLRDGEIVITDKMMLLASVIVNNLGSSNTVDGLTLEEQGGVMALTIVTETAAKRYEWNCSRTLL